jgi:hypothetical protein
MKEHRYHRERIALEDDANDTKKKTLQFSELPPIHVGIDNKLKKREVES